MMINRHNYEEFFLMYVDNELELHQRKEVELFVEQCPDLAPELQTLLEATLPADDAITFTSKEQLFRKVGADAIPQEEQFLLYIDNELSQEQHLQVEQAAQQHPHLLQQLHLLQQTVLPIEVIPFARKEALYRHEKERRIIGLRWQQLAAAAVMAGVIAVGGWFFSSRTQPGDNGTPAQAVAVTDNENNQRPAATSATREPAPLAKTQQATTPASAVETQQQPATAMPDNTTSDIAKATPQTLPATQQEHAAVTDHRDVAVALPSQKQDNAIIAPVRETATAALTGTTNTQSTIAHLPEQTGLVKVAQPALAAIEKYAKPTSATQQEIAYKELDTSEDDQSLYVGSLELNRNKVRGLFKKAGRLLGAKAKAVTEDNL